MQNKKSEAVSKAQAEVPIPTTTTTSSTTTTTAGSTTTTSATTTESSPTNPTGTLKINVGDDETATRTVTLNLSGLSSGVLQMKIGNGEYEALQLAKSYELTGGNGEKTVSITLKNESGLESTITDSINFADNTAPTVTARSPEDDSSGNKISVAVSATFNEGILESLVTSSTFSVHFIDPEGEEDPEPVSGSFSFAGNKVSFVPVGNFLPHGDYEVTLTPGIKDLSSNAIATDTWDFSVLGAALIKDIAPYGDWDGSDDFDYTTGYMNTISANGKLYFRAWDDDENDALWKSDGTTAGTVQLHGFYEYDDGLQYLTNVNGTVYFSAFDDEDDNGDVLWKSDGTEDGTEEIEDEDGYYLYYPEYLTNVNGTLYFVANPDDDYDDPVLCKSDGTSDGTTIVEFDGDEIYEPQYLTEVNGVLFFAWDGDNGYELWKLVPGEEPVEVKDINDGEDSDPENLIAVNGTLFFTADDGVNGRELWKLND
ncbi:Ig-like domain-containing protein [Candidatus Riflebacteria bacterium]